MLCGPTPRTADVASWRPKMLLHLRKQGFDGHVFVPEPRNGQWAEEYTDQIDWEEEALTEATVILFWMPRSIAGGMPALTSNDEWGAWKDSGKVVWGSPPNAEKVRYQLHYAKKLGVPICTTMRETAAEAIKMASDRVKNGLYGLTQRLLTQPGRTKRIVTTTKYTDRESPEPAVLELLTQYDQLCRKVTVPR